MTTTTKLPELTGTEKQVAWALDIRAKKFAWFDDMLTGANDTDHNRTAIQAAKNVLASKTDSRFWIDNCKVESRKLIAQNGLQDELKAEFARLTAAEASATEVDAEEYAVSTDAQDVAVTAEISTTAASNSQSLEVQTVPKFKIDSRELQRTLAQISRVVKLSKYSSNHAVCFTATDNNVKIYTYGALFDVCRTIKAQGTCHKVKFALPHKAATMIEKSLAQLIYNNKFTTTTFEHVDLDVSVRCARSLSFDFATIPNTSICTADFPAVPRDDSASTIVLAQAELKMLINSTLYAAENKNFYNPIFNTVNLKADNDSLTLTATDKYQLATATTDKFCGDEFTCNIFADALKFILPLLNGDDDVTITAQEKKVIFTFGDWCIFAKVYRREKFPDFSRILAEDTPVSAVIENSGWGTGRKQLLETIKLIAQATDNSGAIELIFSQGDLTIQSTNSEIGSARRSLEALTFGVENGTARGKFNAKRLLNMLTHVEDTNVEFSLSANTISIRTDNTTAVISPMKNSVELPKGVLVLENVA